MNEWTNRDIKHSKYVVSNAKQKKNGVDFFLTSGVAFNLKNMIFFCHMNLSLTSFDEWKMGYHFILLYCGDVLKLNPQHINGIFLVVMGSIYSCLFFWNNRCVGDGLTHIQCSFKIPRYKWVFIVNLLTYFASGILDDMLDEQWIVSPIKKLE